MQSMPEALADMEATLDGLHVGRLLRVCGREVIQQVTPSESARQIENLIMAMVDEGLNDADDWWATKALKSRIQKLIRRRVSKASEELVRSL